MPTALPYEEPSLVHLLLLSSFIYLLNVARALADFLLHGGIVAEIALGIVYGSPLASLLPTAWEESFIALGYLGLILVVFEGGLSSNLSMLLSNLPLSTICALVGIGLPIAFSFALLHAAFGYRPLEAFAAGAALSSTSLGTTLAALNSVSQRASVSGKDSDTSPESAPPTLDRSLPTTRAPSPMPRADTSTTLPPVPSSKPLQQSRIATVLISAAIIDDVVGLVIAAVIPALAAVESDSSQSNHASLAWAIIRPLLSSLLIAAIAPVISRFVLRPLFWCHRMGERWCAPASPDKPWAVSAFSKPDSAWGTEAHADAVKLFLMVCAISAMAAISHYTGTSVLYGAYVAGLILTYISRPPQPDHASPDLDVRLTDHDYRHQERVEALSFETTFARTLGPVQNYLLLPLFFASIGFAIPFLDLWNPTIVWRGIVYSILMCLAKLAVGLPILLHAPLVHHTRVLSKDVKSSVASVPARLTDQVTSFKILRSAASPTHTLPSSSPPPREPPTTEKPVNQTPNPSGRSESNHTQTRPSPIFASSPAAAFMGVAMVARGEIGLLIAQIARGDPTSSTEAGLLSTEPFLLCIWAILVCTLVGPISLGFIVRRWGDRVNAGIWA
ncbi:Sodium/hydrogen exchanger [Pilatotrama ljubarskyi]|nr:Sodium/hydrogen exchanger [Pilatotrama ljubarskyi]